ncbi:MAG: hypothetical protein DRI46_12220 [Chloroflexi bacterium]|nr:MAG: hypothetical protein DRI46_12220 [Chloroflexota bacterium]
MFVEEIEVGVIPEVTDHSALYTPLLGVAINPDPLAIGGGNVSVVNGALVSTGPVGEDEVAASSNNSDEISVYTVREGDSLSQVAEMYGVTTNTIMWANDLTKASSIQPGDTLVILPIAGVSHTVEETDTLASIVKEYEADLDEVLAFNNLDSADDLSVGDELIIPGGEMQTIYIAPKLSSSGGGGSNFVHPAPGSKHSQGIHGYNAVDLAGSFGSGVRAAGSGEVIVSKASGWNGGYGQYIVVKHSNGTQTLYAHLSSNSVGVGAWVGAGEVIGGMGNSGKSTGVHLHFEVRGGYNPF